MSTVSPPCTFQESDICGFTQSTDDESDWILGSGGTPSSGTGPRSDHSTGTNGLYIICFIFFKRQFYVENTFLSETKMCHYSL